jgi:hypothetical protein
MHEKNCGICVYSPEKEDCVVVVSKSGHAVVISVKMHTKGSFKTHRDFAALCQYASILRNPFGFGTYQPVLRPITRESLSL